MFIHLQDYFVFANTSRVTKAIADTIVTSSATLFTSFHPLSPLYPTFLLPSLPLPPAPAPAHAWLCLLLSKNRFVLLVSLFRVDLGFRLSFFNGHIHLISLFHFYVIHLCLRKIVCQIFHIVYILFHGYSDYSIHDL